MLILRSHEITPPAGPGREITAPCEITGPYHRGCEFIGRCEFIGPCEFIPPPRTRVKSRDPSNPNGMSGLIPLLRSARSQVI